MSQLLGLSLKGPPRGAEATFPFHRGFFLRAEDFFGFQKRLVSERHELEQRLEEIDRSFADRSAWAKGLAANDPQAFLRRLG